MINVAIVGAGIGQAHLKGYLALPDLYCVKIVCDLDAERAKGIIREEAGKGDAVSVTTDMAVVLADVDIDLVDICLPPHLHFSAAKAALQAGKHVICEKPMVASLREADALIEIAHQSKRLLSPVFQYRYGRAMTQLAALRDAGLVGRPYAASLETHWNRGADYYAVDWRGTWKGENGGAVLGHAIHNHDLLTMTLGPIRRLTAHLTTRVNDIEVEDCAAISFEMKSGALATSSISLGAANDTSRIRLVFEHITAESGTEPYAPAIDTWTFTARQTDNQAKVDEIVDAIQTVPSGFEGFFTEFAQQIHGHPHHAVTIEDGRQSIELVAAIYQSARLNTAVELPLGKSTPLYDGWAPRTHVEEN